MNFQPAKIIRPDFAPYRLAANTDIVVTDNREIFNDAANDESCRAVIFKKPDEQKDKERAILRSIWPTLADPSEHFGQNGFGYYEHNMQDLDIDHSPTLRPVSNLLTDMAGRYCEMSGQMRAMPQIIANWREENTNHAPHDFCVLNTVYFANGTLLPTNFGHYQVSEGDELYMKPLMPHSPEIITPENKDKDRVTVVVTPYIA